MAARDVQDINELISKYTRERDSAVGPLRWWRGKQLKRLHVAAAKAADGPVDGVTKRGRAGRGGGRVLAPRALGLVIEGSTVQMPGLWPWTIGGNSPAHGAPVGHHLIHGRPFHYDALEWFRKKYISAPVTVIIASNGYGKTTLAARLMIYAIACGRCPIVAGDVKPDHAERIKSMGGQHIKCGRDIINPLAPGALGATAAQLTQAIADWRGTLDDDALDELIVARDGLLADLRQMQVLNVKTLLRMSRDSGQVNDVESSLLDEAMAILNDDPAIIADNRAPEIADLDYLLDHPTADMMAAVVAADRPAYDVQAAALLRSVRALKRGAFGRMFSGQTTQPIQADAIGIDIDVSGIAQGDQGARAAAIAIGWTEAYSAVTAAHALADAGLGPRRVFDLFFEELWQVLGAGTVIVELLNRESRTNRTKGTTITMMTHSVADFAGSVDSASVEMAQAIFEKCQARIYGRIGNRELERLEHFENFTDPEIAMFRSWGRTNDLHSDDPGNVDRKVGGLGSFILKIAEADTAGIPFVTHLPQAEIDAGLHNTSARLNADEQVPRIA